MQAMNDLTKKGKANTHQLNVPCTQRKWSHAASVLQLCVLPHFFLFFISHMLKLLFHPDFTVTVKTIADTEKTNPSPIIWASLV